MSLKKAPKKNVYFYDLANSKHIEIRWTQTDRIRYWLVCSSKKIYWLVWSRSLRFAH